MNTRSKVSLTNLSFKNLQLPHKQRQTTTSSSLSIIPSSAMSSKDNPISGSSDVQAKVANEQIKKLFVDNINLEKQLESKQLLATEEQIETNDSLHSNTQLIQENQQPFENNEEQSSDLNTNHSNNLDEKSSLLDFLRSHISPFSGNENAEQWFIHIDSTFSNLKLSFADRLEILPYFFVGRSIIWYSLNKHKINYYTDFCQLFALEYLNIKQTPDPHIPSQSSNKYSLVNSQAINDKDSNNNSVDHLTNITTPFISHYIPSNELSNLTPSHSLSSTISKALIDKFVKDPLKFYGGKDSVITWLDEIEQQFHIMQLSELDKFNLIHICLKGEAQQWYRQNKKQIVCWSQFVSEIKNSYHSNLQRDIAFKKLQQYHQTVHQSAFQYHNEILKLIQQADPQMNESTKVHYLMNGLRPSLSIETRRNYPKTTQEFLTQVKIAEDLTALNNTFTNQSMIHDDLPAFISSSYSKSINQTSTNESSDYPRNTNVDNYHYQNNYSSPDNNQQRYVNKNYHSSSRSNEPNQSSQPSRQKFNITSTNYPPPLLGQNNHRNNNFTKQSQQTIQRCFQCGSLDHIARHCPHFTKRSQ